MSAHAAYRAIKQANRASARRGVNVSLVEFAAIVCGQLAGFYIEGHEFDMSGLLAMLEHRAGRTLVAHERVQIGALVRAYVRDREGA
jgi:hypothetical protein